MTHELDAATDSVTAAYNRKCNSAISAFYVLHAIRSLCESTRVSPQTADKC